MCAGACSSCRIRKCTTIVNDWCHYWQLSYPAQLSVPIVLLFQRFHVRPCWSEGRWVGTHGTMFVRVGRRVGGSVHTAPGVSVLVGGSVQTAPGLSVLVGGSVGRY